MIETINLELIPNRLIQNMSKTPFNILFEGSNCEYGNLVNKISSTSVKMFNGSYENVVNLDNDRVLFANTYELINIYNTITSNELNSLIDVLFNKISIFKFEEDISIFHIDKILANTKNLVKISELPKLSIDYIISTDEPIVLNTSKDSMSFYSNDMKINHLLGLSIRSLLVQEISNSLVIIKLANNHLIDVGDIIRKLNMYSSIIKYDKKNRLIAFKLNLIVDLPDEFASCKSSNIIRDLVLFDRTDWIASAIK